MKTRTTAEPTPEKLSPMSVRSGGGAIISAAQGGDLFVLGTVKMTPSRVGTTAKVLFPGFSRADPTRQCETARSYAPAAGLLPTSLTFS